MNDEFDTTIKDKFQEPQKRFWLRSRKRRNSDAISVSSMDISIGSEAGKRKKRRRITEVASSLFSTPTGSRLAGAFHRSLGFQTNAADLSLVGDENDYGTLRKKVRSSGGQVGSITIRSWIVDVAAESHVEGCPGAKLTRGEVKRQEAIYELYCGEDVLLRDLANLREIYYDPLVNSRIFTTVEIGTLFGDIPRLVRIHSELRDELVKLRDPAGFTETVGPTIVNWLPSLVEPYVERCRSQVWARHLIDERKATSRRFQEFLKKQLDSPRSVDLWTYLDVPRSRIVKYPLLVNEILRHTPADHADQEALKQASGALTQLLRKIDGAMGDAECKIARGRINPNPEYDADGLIGSARELITEGQLKDARGTKLHCFLFDTCFALTRPSRRSGKRYNLFSAVIPSARSLVGTDDRKTAIGFRVGEHFLVTEDEHARRHWLEAFKRIDCGTVPAVVEEAAPEKRVLGDKGDNVPSVLDAASPRPRQQPKRRSVSSLCDTHFPISLRKSLLRHKRNSIGYV